MSRFEELLTEYGNSLEDVRKVVEGMEGAGARWSAEGEAGLFTSREARELFGIELPAADYMLKLRPDAEGPG